MIGRRSTAFSVPPRTRAHITRLRSLLSAAAYRDRPHTVLTIDTALLVASRARDMRWPATAYGLVILVMAWRASAAWAVLGSFPALLALAGALLFVVSDTLLAINRFIRQFRWSKVAVLGTYYAGQALIAASLWPISATAFLEP